MKFGTFDNEAYMRREYWEDGELRQWINCQVLFCAQTEAVIGRPIPIQMNVGKWDMFRLIGDLEALPEEWRSKVRKHVPWKETDAVSSDRKERDKIGVQVWMECWNGFKLEVRSVDGGFQAAAFNPWDNYGKAHKRVFDTIEGAQKGCWGIVRGDCELKAAQAAQRMTRGEQ